MTGWTGSTRGNPKYKLDEGMPTKLLSTHSPTNKVRFLLRMYKQGTKEPSTKDNIIAIRCQGTALPASIATELVR
jgi:hypothetical protein